MEDILGDSKHLRPQRLYDFLTRYEAIVRQRHPWESLNFEDKRVIELAAGPVLGWAPLAVFLECRSYTCVEPYFNPDVFESKALIDGYFLTIYKDLCAVYGHRVDFATSLQRLRSRTEVLRSEGLYADLEGPYDIALSNSCLEHILALDETIRCLKSVSAPDCRFLHLVDFGNHRGIRNPFDGLYSVEPQIYFGVHKKSINLLRAPDVIEIFRECGFDAELVSYYFFREFYTEDIIPYWSERYSEDDLFLKACIIAGPIAK